MRLVMSDEAAAATPTPPAPRARTAAVLVAVALIWVVVQIYALSLTPFHTRGEAREAILVQELVRHGDWILPRRNGVQLPRKPPLFYWLAALTARAAGALDEASIRLPSALMSGVACLLITAVAGAFYGGLAAALSGLTLLMSFEWLRAATSARVDMTLAFGLTLVFAALLRFRHAGRRG